MFNYLIVSELLSFFVDNIILTLMKLLFFIREMALDSKNRGDLHLHTHKEHELVYCFAGESKNIQKGDLYFYPAGRKHSVTIENGKAVKIWQIYFSEDLFSNSVNMDKEALFVLGQIKLYLKRGTRIGLSKIGSERVGKLFESMQWEFKNRYHGYSWTIRLKLIELLVTVIRDREFVLPIRGDIAKPLSNGHIQDVLLYLNTNYMNQITVDEILQFCPLSRSHFHALFKNETGTTLVKYLNDLRCQRAGELLATTDDTILDIAMTCGFNNFSHFCHTFKEVYGYSPGQFRKNYATLKF